MTCSPRTVRIVVVGVIRVVCRDSNANRTTQRSEKLHSHALRNNQCTVNQRLCIIEDVCKNLCCIRISGILHTHNLLLVLFLDKHGFTEECHFSFGDSHADTISQRRLCIEIGRHKRNRQTVCAGNPFQIKTGFLLCREQTFAQIRNAQSRIARIVQSNRFRVKCVRKFHSVLPPFTDYALNCA